MNQLKVLMLINGFIALAKGKGGCKVLDYLDCLKNKRFTGHVIKSFRVLAPGLENCQHKCFLEDKCVSYNLGPVEGTIRSCELNDADHVSDPGDVVSKEDFEYCPIKNPCSSSPCRPRQWCTPDFYWDTFNCSDGRWTEWGEWPCFCPRKRTRRCITPRNTTGVCDGKGRDSDSKECRAVIDIQGCSEPLGMQDGRIKDDQISASSFRHANCRASFGRLYKNSTNVYEGSWCSKVNGIGQYLQIDLRSITWVTKIATQGRNTQSHTQWVTEYTLSFSNDTETWQSYKGDQECVKRFIGNKDRNTVVTHSLPVPIKARYVRFVAQKWKRRISMRVELYGCTSV